MLTASRGPRVFVTLTDPDGTYLLEARFVYWPVAAPEQRREVFPVWAGLGDASAYFPTDLLQDGGTYTWAARGEDGHTTSEWSEPCLFTTDYTRPTVAPTITSPVYQEDGGPPGDGGEGVPGDFTFTANGMADVVAFEYSGLGVPYGRVSADRPGGSATVSVLEHVQLRTYASTPRQLNSVQGVRSKLLSTMNGVRRRSRATGGGTHDR
ncbi:MAG: hypothetical protein ABIQ18_43835 [Umezawaea sp.]